jgi:3-phenylpropionate/trans-cinnamate dioxygenase ferredoxin subunit
MTWTRIGSAADVEQDEAMAVEAGGSKLALFRSGDTYYVTDNVCTHQYALLSEGFVEDGCVECPLHEARFDLATGKALCGPATVDIKVYPVRIEGSDILADV